ncbi:MULTISPECIES: hypothetical protein [unclassified Brevundimonas]|uniref:hypothetical protein n=1 Tax=unclassified Brevundimonas TaxID=2622653 RepID=UPI003F8E43C8
MSEADELPKAVVALVVDHWRLLRSLERLVDQLPEGAGARTAGQVRFQQGRLNAVLDDLALTLATYEGRVFDGTLPATGQNADEFPPETAMRVGDTIEPTVLWRGRVVHAGRVNLVVSGDV